MEQLFWIAYWIGFGLNALALLGLHFCFRRGDYFSSPRHEWKFLTVGAIGVVFSVATWVILGFALAGICLYQWLRDEWRER